MVRNKDLIQLRNKNVKIRFNKIQEKYPNWKYDAILKELTTEFYISKRTISAILNNEGTYNI
ncbi:MAG TPA: hypothetical protein EYP87_05925 [Flavobacteriaceae bacterium]|nr:hypothetical protein [Flavobacteriaceae bacterium]